MKNYNILTVLIIAAMLSFTASYSLALDEAQEEAFQEAVYLLNEGNLANAKSILKQLQSEDPSNFKIRITLINATIEEAKILKSANNSVWKSKVHAAFGELKGIYRANTTSPEVFIAFARCYALNDRPEKADKSLRKALYYRPGDINTIIAKGDIYFEKSKKVLLAAGVKKRGNFCGGNCQMRKDKKAAIKYYYEALSRSDLDAGSKAMINYRIAEVSSYHGNRKNEIKHLNKVVELSPDSYWGNESRMRLSKLQLKK